MRYTTASEKRSWAYSPLPCRAGIEDRLCPVSPFLSAESMSTQDTQQFEAASLDYRCRQAPQVSVRRMLAPSPILLLERAGSTQITHVFRGVLVMSPDTLSLFNMLPDLHSYTYYVRLERARCALPFALPARMRRAVWPSRQPERQTLKRRSRLVPPPSSPPTNVEKNRLTGHPVA